MDYKEFINKQSKQQYNAITFFHYTKNRAPMKHRGITNKSKFESWAKDQGALYINYYFKDTKDFDQRKWLN
jgi:hypothetical protein